jgi:hypothetical protein
VIDGSASIQQVNQQRPPFQRSSKGSASDGALPFVLGEIVAPMGQRWTGIRDL